ncbi:hypothetical protein CC1G_09854 [Coprinopsis cinerea okayama7|uniref:Uncharacterized protein n=1 Tax=Coprinopsis cinerea (strain Okayama-7 / 130 / ATCC MYA-4618 / FGSC 9003) TaxID=240176 RepID=A8P0E5_COPC7|nr:hypothetical protein CC1G_09854 [Coprinopsis cinerea okayama7\|eukprot:XP_001837872.2 hypothetical protein CC1G_09854 [Coprinopsis cinerea okayama7\
MIIEDASSASTSPPYSPTTEGSEIFVDSPKVHTDGSDEIALHKAEPSSQAVPDISVEEIDENTPTIRQSLDDFERSFARPWTRKTLQLCMVPEPVARFIETPTVLAFALATGYFIFVASLYSMKKIVVWSTSLAYRIFTNSVSYSLSMFGFLLSALVLFTILATIFISIKACIFAPFHLLQFLSGVSTWHEAAGDSRQFQNVNACWEPYLTEFQRHLEDQGINIQSMIQQLRSYYQAFQLMFSGYSQVMQGRNFDEQGRQWAKFAWKKTLRLGFFTWVSLKWMGWVSVMVFYGSAWLFRMLRGQRRAGRGVRG